MLSRVWLFCDPMACSPPRSSVHGISQARVLKWVAICLSRGSSQSRDRTCVSCIGRWILYHWATWEAPYLFFFKFFSHLGCYRILSRVLTLHSRSLLFIYFKYSSVYTSIPNSQSILLGDAAAWPLPRLPALSTDPSTWKGNRTLTHCRGKTAQDFWPQPSWLLFFQTVILPSPNCSAPSQMASLFLSSPPPYPTN